MTGCFRPGFAFTLAAMLAAAVCACNTAPSTAIDQENGAEAPVPRSDDPPARVRATLDGIRKGDADQLAVSEEDGRFLRVLVASAGAANALEIGGASGYSAIWIGLGLRETGGRLTTIEYDPARAKQAAANIERAGLSDIVRVVAGDGFEEVPKLEGTFDFVFLDAWKKDYARFLALLMPRMNAGGLFVAHNVVNKRDEMPDFLGAITGDRALFTAIVTPSGEGMSVSYKRR
ncbi:MAG: O-methyltransferase [Vicinamibacterales bacterium]